MKLSESNKLIESLSTRFDALQEFVTANIGVPAGRLQAPPTNTTDNSPPQNEDNSPPQNEGDSNTTTPSTTNSDSLSQVTPFQPVRNGAKPSKKRVLPVITLQNKFQILAETVEEPHDVRLIGDSIIRQQLVEFCGRAPTHRKRFCIPGAYIDDVKAASDEVSDGANNDTLFVLHVGTNDIQQTRSEALLQKYREMMQHFKTKSNNVMISGILPRMSAANSFFSKAFSLNNQLRTLCSQEGVEFIDTWDHFFPDARLVCQ